MLDLETGVESWCAGEEDGFFGLAGQNDILEIDRVVFSALLAQNCLDQLVGNGVELVGPEDLDEDEIDELLA